MGLGLEFMLYATPQFPMKTEYCVILLQGLDRAEAESYLLFRVAFGEASLHDSFGISDITDNEIICVVCHFIYSRPVMELALNFEGCEATFQTESSPPPL